MQAQDDQDDYFCELPVYLFEEDELSRAASNREKERFRLSLTIIPVVAPIVAFMSYDFVYLAFHEILDATRMWFSVDGGKSEIELITPLINGVVQPATGFVFGTLLASTIGSLRNRQVAIRASLNKEACDLRTLDSVLNNIYSGPGDASRRRMLLNLLQQYVSRVIIESRGESEAVISRTSESELDGITRSIYSEPKGAHQHSTAGADPSTQSAYVGPMRDALPQLFQSLYYQRSQRLAELQTSYPAIHWIILSLLASSIIINFLIESDSSSLQFLNSFRLRVLFTIIIGVMSAVATLCADLNDPFRGNFQITPSADQLYVIRDTLAEEQCASLPLEERPASDSAIERRAEQAGYTGKGL